MHLHQFFINHTQIKENSIYVYGNDAQHIINVLRLKPGNGFIAIDESGNRFNVEIEKIVTDEVKAKILQIEKPAIKKLKIHLFPSLLKGEAWETVLKKGTELGLSSFTPVISSRTVVKINANTVKNKTNRWEKIIYESAKQCKRIDIPEIFPIISFHDALKSKADLNLIFWEEEKSVNLKKIFPLKNIAENINVFIGPEGGFTKEEIESAKKNNFNVVSLGKNILRADTASISAVSVLLYEL